MVGPGVHLMVDGLSRLLFTNDYLQAFLRDVVELVGMHVIMGPVVQGGRNKWDGWVVLAESHAAIHVHQDIAHVDLFSCQWFETDHPIDFIQHRLKLTDMRIEVLERPMPAARGGRK